MSDQKAMRMYYDKSQANTQITVEEWDRLKEVLAFETQFWMKIVKPEKDEKQKDYCKRILEKITGSTDDPLVQRMFTEGRIATLELLSNPETPTNVLHELRKNLEMLNNNKITSSQGSTAVLRGINPEELKKIEKEAIRAHLALMKDEESKARRTKKMNVH